MKKRNMQIVRLQGPDRIRKRPAVAFESEDAEGVKALVLSILNIYVTEAQRGLCSRIDVTQKGASLVVAGDDRGICLGQENGDTEQWKHIFEDFFCPPAQAPSEEGYIYALCDTSQYILYGDPVKPSETLFPEDTGCFALYCAQCACRQMEVTAVRKGVKSTLTFEKGYPVGGITHESTAAPSGTVFSFTPDAEVFSDVTLPAEFFLSVLERFAMLSPGLVCTYRNAEGLCREFCYPGGIRDYAGGCAPVYHKKISARGKERYNTAEYEACVEVAVAPAPERGRVLCFHNFRALPQGGTHLQMLETRLCGAFGDMFFPVTFEELRDHLSVVLASWCTPRCTRWENGTRRSIANRVVADMTWDAAAAELQNYVYENKEQLKLVAEAILRRRKDEKSPEA